MTVRVLIVDDQEPFRMAARMVVDATEGFEVVGEAETGEDRRTGPRALARPRPHGCEPARHQRLDATRQILADGADKVVVLLLSTYEEEEYAPRAAECGASAYIPKAVFGLTGSRPRGPTPRAPTDRPLVRRRAGGPGAPERDRAGDRGPRARRRADPQLAADGVEPVGHPLQAGSPGRRSGVEADAVVADLEPQSLVPFPHGDPDRRRVRVLRDVLQSPRARRSRPWPRAPAGTVATPSGSSVTGNAVFLACASSAAGSPLSAMAAVADPAGEVAQVLQGLVRLCLQLHEELAGLRRVALDDLVGQPEPRRARRAAAARRRGCCVRAGGARDPGRRRAAAAMREPRSGGRSEGRGPPGPRGRGSGARCGSSGRSAAS